MPLAYPGVTRPCGALTPTTLERNMQTNPLGHNVDLAERAYRIRRNALLMGEVQGQGYIGQALDIADVLAVAYFHATRYRPEDPHWEERDRFLLSNGHYAIALYAVLELIPIRPLAATGSGAPGNYAGHS